MRAMDIIEKMERGAVSGSRSVSQLADSYSRKSVYLSLLEEVRAFARRRRLPENALDLLEQRSSQGTIYVLIGPEFERLNRELATQLLNLLRDEVLGQELGGQDRWKEFLGTYERVILDSYRNLLNSSSGAAIVYEVTCRLLFELSFEDWWEEAPELRERQGEIARRFSKELNGLFHHLRERIATTLRFDDSLVAESLGKALIIPGPPAELDPKVLEEAIEEKGVTLNLIEEVDRVVSATLRQSEEKAAVNLLSKSHISSKADIPKLLERHQVHPSTEGLKTMKSVLAEKGEELKRRASSELEEAKKALSPQHKKFAEGVQAISEGLRSLTSEISSPEGLVAVGEEMRDRAEVLLKFLDRSLWSLKQLSKREEELRRTVMSGEALVQLTSDEIEQLLRRPDLRGRIVNLYATYEMLQESGTGVKQLGQKARRELTRVISEEEKRWAGTEKVRLLEGMATRPIFRKTYDLDELLARYVTVMSEIIEPLIVSKRIEEMVRIWPPQVEDASETDLSSLLEEARYLGEVLAVKAGLYQLSAGDDVRVDFSASSEEADLSTIVKQNCSEVVSLLVYDIRGSTFMGKKLKDAKVESEIRNKFQRRMIDVARRLGGFPIKDTGDGGIVFFSANSDESYRNYHPPRGEEDAETQREAVLLKGKPGLTASTQSAEMAIRCAIGMVAEAQKFVEENLARYADWFRKAEETTLLYEGLTYAKLPPQYKRIFKIGIGVASGAPDVDIFFALNSFGDLDVTGNLVRDANLYSKVKAEEGSVVLCDGPTVLNFLLNAEEFQPPLPKKTRVEGLTKAKRRAALRDEVRKWWDISKKWGEYRLEDLGAVIRRMGYQAVFTDEREGEPLTLEAKGVRIDEYGRMRDEKGREVKVLYEVIREGQPRMEGGGKT